MLASSIVIPVGSIPFTLVSWLGFFEIFVEIALGSNVGGGVDVVPVLAVVVVVPLDVLVDVDAVVVAGFFDVPCDSPCDGPLVFVVPLWPVLPALLSDDP